MFKKMFANKAVGITTHFFNAEITNYFYTFKFDGSKIISLYSSYFLKLLPCIYAKIEILFKSESGGIFNNFNQFFKFYLFLPANL